MAKNISKVENRRFIRHPMCFPLSYKVLRRDAADAVKEVGTVTKNISRGGLLFSSKKPAQEGALILIKIPFQAKIFHINANVVHCNKVQGTKLYDIGISFDRVNDAFKIKLIEQMYLISEYRDLMSMQMGKDMTLQEASQEWIKRYSSRFSKLYW
jgi:hypothetical protein